MKNWLNNWYLSCGSGIYNFMDLFILAGILTIIVITVYGVKKHLKNIYYCKVCGNKIEKDWITCPYCGRSLKR